jgi:8-oxo-dGTP diphosphatase / 2-hydroxy-dATP diphosphatase
MTWVRLDDGYYQHPKILLGMKKRGFGEGKWNGFGGKVDESETLEEAAKRELEEEAGIEAAQLEKSGILNFEFRGSSEILEVHVFKSESFSGEPKESEEMKPKWFFIDEIPFREMWPDDIYWFPLFLRNKKFKGDFVFGEGDAVLSHTLIEVESL